MTIAVITNNVNFDNRDLMFFSLVIQGTLETIRYKVVRDERDIRGHRFDGIIVTHSGYQTKNCFELIDMIKEFCLEDTEIIKQVKLK